MSNHDYHTRNNTPPTEQKDAHNQMSLLINLLPMNHHKSVDKKQTFISF